MSDQARREAAELLEPTLGAEATNALMSTIPTLDHLDARFDQVEAHLADHDRQLAAIHTKLDGVDHRFDAIDSKFDAIDSKFDGIDNRFDGQDVRFENTQNKIIAAFRGELHAAVTTQTRIAVYGMAGLMMSLSALLLTAVVLLR